jgi:non-heme chloroperoxidase
VGRVAEPVVPVEEQVKTANASGRVPVVFIHGLWLLASSWARAISHAACKRQEHNPGVTEFTELPGRGHSLTIPKSVFPAEVRDLVARWLRP